MDESVPVLLDPAALSGATASPPTARQSKAIRVKDMVWSLQNIFTKLCLAGACQASEVEKFWSKSDSRTAGKRIQRKADSSPPILVRSQNDHWVTKHQSLRKLGPRKAASLPPNYLYRNPGQSRCSVGGKLSDSRPCTVHRCMHHCRQSSAGKADRLPRMLDSADAPVTQCSSAQYNSKALILQGSLAGFLKEKRLKITIIIEGVQILEIDPKIQEILCSLIYVSRRRWTKSGGCSGGE